MKNIIYVLIVVVVGLAIWGLSSSKFNKTIPQVPISQIANEVQAGKVQNIVVDGNKVTATLKDNKGEIQAYKEQNVGLQEYGITPKQVSIDVVNPDKNAFLPSFLSIFLPVVLFAGVLYFLMRQAQGGNMRAMSFGKTTARLFTGAKRITFENVAGLFEPKQELSEIVEFLKQPEKFQKLGAEIPKGVLLIGPAGVGKTLLAKAVAGEAEVPFFSLSASEFVEMFVGVGAARVRDLFQKAKRNSPCVIFIDELDAIGRQRGTGLGGSHDEREQTLNQILVEMDGFETDTRVIILAATNRPDVLDPALLRPGRFDRKVVLDIPDKTEREQILAVHGINKPLAGNVNLGKIAQATPGLSGADLKNVMNEAAILAARENNHEVTQKDLQAAIEKVMLGPERKSHVMSEAEKRIAAFHEAGHAIVGRVLPDSDPIHKVSVISRGMALGYTWSLPDEDRHLQSKKKFEDDIAQLLGGRVSEEIVFNDITTGAQNDVKRATKLARDMVTVYGMSDLGPIALGEREEPVFLGRELAEHKNYSEQIAASIDKEVSRFINEGQQKAKRVLEKYRKVLDELAGYLIKEETIEGEELENIFSKLHLPASEPKPTPA